MNTPAALSYNHPTTTRLLAVAALWNRFAHLGMTEAAPGGYAKACICTGNATLASARGRTLAAAMENLLRKVDGLPFLAAQAVDILNPAATVITAADAVDPAEGTLRCVGCSRSLAGKQHLGVTTRFGEKFHYCSFGCRRSFGVAR